MRIGLLYVDNFEQKRSQRIGSLGLGYIAAYVQQHMPGLEVKIAVTPQELLCFDPDIVGVSAYSETLPIARAHAAFIRGNKDIPMVLGGAHIATNPGDLPPEFDFGVAGEGEEVFLKLVQLLEQNALVPANLKGIQGLTHRDQGQIRNQGRCPSMQDMDVLAHPDRRLMFETMYHNFPDFQPVVHIHTARGCPYRCTFCSAPLVNPSWRFHSPEWVLAELELIQQQFPHIREITISDDLFTLKKKRLIELVEIIRAHDMHKHFSFFCSSRSNTLTHDMGKLLRDMNVVMVSFGFESASDRIIRDLKGVGTHRCDYERVLQMCEHYGIYAHGNFIVGTQDETQSDLQSTWEFVRDNYDRLGSVYFSHMTPFPGTKVWDDGLAARLFEPETLNYRVLNLEYAKGDSVFLNTHYDEDFYEAAYTQIKDFETNLCHRYYKEQTLIADVTQQERWLVPERLLALVQEQNWQKVDLITDYETWIPDLDKDPRFHVSSSQEILAGKELQGDAVLLFYVLDQNRKPQDILDKVAGRPVLSLNYHIGSYQILSQLLLGVWQQALYGANRRRNVTYFTLKSLQKLMGKYQLDLHFVQRQRFNTPLNYRPLHQLLGQDQVIDPDTFSYLTLWQPGAVSGST